MRSELWLIDPATQREIAKAIDDAADAVVANFDRHWNENSLTAAFGQNLLQREVVIAGTVARFDYRNFSEIDEEPVTGADGGILVTVTNRTDTVKKAVLFQAKKFSQDRNVKDLSLTRAEAKRLKNQIERMIPITKECIVLAHTRDRIYAVDGRCADGQSVEHLRHLTERCRLVSVGTFLGKWVARCSRGDTGRYVVENVETPRGFLRHQVTMTVTTDQRPLLVSGQQLLDQPDFISGIRRRT